MDSQSRGDLSWYWNPFNHFAGGVHLFVKDLVGNLSHFYPGSTIGNARKHKKGNQTSANRSSMIDDLIVIRPFLQSISKTLSRATEIITGNGELTPSLLEIDRNII